MIDMNPESLRRIRQRKLLPAGCAAMALAGAGDLVLGSAAAFAAGLVGLVAVAGLMATAMWLERRTENPEFSEISGFRWQEDAP